VDSSSAASLEHDELLDGENRVLAGTGNEMSPNPDAQRPDWATVRKRSSPRGEFIQSGRPALN